MCTKGNGNYVQIFRSCKTNGHDLGMLGVWCLLWILCGSLACFRIQHLRSKNRTLYEQRARL